MGSRCQTGTAPCKWTSKMSAVNWKRVGLTAFSWALQCLPQLAAAKQQNSYAQPMVFGSQESHCLEIKLHRHRPQIAFQRSKVRCLNIHKAAAFYCEFASVHLPLVPQAAIIKPWRETSFGKVAAKSSPDWRSWRGTSLEDKAAAAAKSSPEWRSWRETSLGDKAAAAAKSSPSLRSKNRPEWRSWRETSLGNKAAAAAKSRPEWRSWRETSLGVKGTAGAKSSPDWRSWRGTSLEDKAAAAANSSPEWRSWRETDLGDKAAAAAKSSPEWRSWRETSLGEKAAASRPFGDFGDQQPSHWEVRTPIASSYLVKKKYWLLKSLKRKKRLGRLWQCAVLVRLISQWLQKRSGGEISSPSAQRSLGSFCESNSSFDTFFPVNLMISLTFLEHGV